MPKEIVLSVQIENLGGKTFVFQIQLNDYNLKYEWEFYTVKKVFDFVVEADKAIQFEKMIEVYTSICCNTFLNLFYWQTYISDTSNECNSNLSSEQDDDSIKFQKVDVESNIQLKQTFVIKKIKRSYSVTTTKQQRKRIQRIL